MREPAAPPRVLPESASRPVQATLATAGQTERALRTLLGALILVTLGTAALSAWNTHLLWDLEAHGPEGLQLLTTELVAVALQALLAGVGFVVLRAALRRQARDVEALAASAGLLRAYFEQAAVGIAQIGADRRILRANPRLAEILGRPLAELSGASPVQFSHPDDRDVLTGPRHRLYAGAADHASGTKRYLRPDGSTVWVRVTLSLVRDGSGAPGYEIAVFEDVTRERHAAARKRRLRAAFDLSFDAMYVVSQREMRIVDANQAACRMLGYARDELVGADPLILFADPTLTRERLKAEYDAIVASGGHARFETVHRRKDGSAVAVEVQRTRLAIDGQDFVLGAARDITERRAADAALRESEERYRRLVEVSPDAVFVIQCGRIALANPASLRLFGAERADQLLGRQVMELIHPESRDLVDERLTALAAGAAELPRIEQRYLRLDGTPVEVEVMAARLQFSGAPAVLTVARDVGERKRADAALVDANRRLQLATQAANVSIWDTDLTDGTVYLSEGWAKLLGNEPGETRTTLRALADLVHPGDLPRIVEASMQVARGERESYAEEQRVRTRDGEWRWILSGGRVIEHDACGRALRMAGTNHDISDRKRGEALLAVEHAVTRCLASAADLAEGLRAAVGILCQAESWDFARIFEVDARAGLLRGTGVWTRDGEDFEKLVDETRGVAFAPGVGLAGRVWQSGEPIWVADVRGDPRVHNVTFFNAYGLRSAFVFPVATQGRVIGAVAAFGRSVRAPDARLLRAIGAVSSQIGQFLARKRAEARLARHAEHQERIARFGSFALDEHDPARLFDEAVRAAAGAEADAATLIEIHPMAGEFIVRAATGVADCTAGRRGPLAADSVWPQIVADGTARAVGADYLRARPALADGTHWVHAMASAVYVPVRYGARPYGVLAIYSAREHAFGDDGVRHLEAIASILATTLQRREAQAHLEQLAQFDALTGLPNRALFRDRLDQALSQARRNDWEVGLLFLDLDQFKRINDTLGHGAGDEALRVAARRLQQCLRSGDTVARLSGDEFAVVLPDLDSPEGARTVAQKMLETLRAPLHIGGRELFVGASAGITVFPHDALDAETLLQNADVAMYQAKEAGRDGCRFFTPDMNADTARLLELERDLRYALERGEFELHFQPKADVTGARITGAEALLRWRRSDGSLVLPAEFIPVLEDSGLIVAVGDWALEEACRHALAWREAGRNGLRVAVNVSARQFRDGRLAESVRRALAQTGCPPAALEIEVTESMVMHDVEVTAETLEALRALGVRVAVDDFGTGYSSLAYLKRLPVDTLKIDRSFVRDVCSDPNDAAIVTAILGMARALGYSVVAEGVENPLQRQFLEAYGCHEIQGHYLSRPLPAGELAAWMDERAVPISIERRAA